MTEDYIRNIRGIRDIRGRRIGDPPFHKGDSEVSPPINGRLGLTGDSEVSPPRKKTGISLEEIPAEATG